LEVFKVVEVVKVVCVVRVLKLVMLNLEHRTLNVELNRSSSDNRYF